MKFALRVYRDGMPTRFKASPLAWPDFRQNTPQWHLVNLEAYLSEGFEFNALIYSAIMYKAKAMRGAPLRAYSGTVDEPEILPEDHQLAKLCARPNASSSPQEIRQRIYNQGDHWFSLWIDAIIQYHTPQGILGADQAYRIQAWQYPENSLFVYGPAGEDPSRVMLSTSGELLIVRPGEGLNWFTPLIDFTELSKLFRLVALLYADQPWTQDMPTARFAVTGTSEQISGRDAILVEQVNQYPRGRTRYCIDSWTGVILCQKRYMHDGDESPYLEMDIRSISYDVQPPLDIIDPFQPWRGGYARASSGDPLPKGDSSLEWTPAETPQARPHNPLPAAYDLSQAQLSFIFPQPLDLLAPNQPARTASSRS